MATIADYQDAVSRIGEQIPPDAETEQDIKSALRNQDDPQLTDNVIDNISEAIISSGDLIEGLSQLGDAPTESEIDALADAIDEYDMGQRADSIAESVADEVVTQSDISEAIEQRSDSGQLFKEDISAAVDQASDGKEIVGTSAEQITQDRAQEEGAPSRSDVRRERAQAAAPDNSVTPANREDLSSNSKTPVNLIESNDGEVIGAVGGVSQGGVSPEQTAEELGVDYLGGIEEVAGSAEITGSGESVDIEIAGEKVGEVDV